MTADQRWENVAAELARKIACRSGLDPPPSSRIMAALHNEYAEGRKAGYEAALRDAAEHVRLSIYGDEDLALQIEALAP